MTLEQALQERAKLDKYIKRLLKANVTETELLLPAVYQYIEDNYNISRNDITGLTRKYHIVDFRRILVKILREEYSLTKVGRILSNRHYSTIINLEGLYETFYSHDESFKKKADDIIGYFNSLKSTEKKVCILCHK